jgi:hypothetical protein
VLVVLISAGCGGGWIGEVNAIALTGAAPLTGLTPLLAQLLSPAQAQTVGDIIGDAVQALKSLPTLTKAYQAAADAQGKETALGDITAAFETVGSNLGLILTDVQADTSTAEGAAIAAKLKDSITVFTEEFQIVAEAIPSFAGAAGVPHAQALYQAGKFPMAARSSSIITRQLWEPELATRL